MSTLQDLKRKGDTLPPGWRTNESLRDLVDRVRRDDPSGMEELYLMVNRYGFFLWRQLGEGDMLERVHDIFLNVVQAVRAGKLRDPERLCGFVTSVARFYVYEEIDRRVAHRKRDVPIESLRPFSDLRVNIESDVYHRERAGIVRQILESLPLRDRDVLHRFYIEEQSKEEICEEMNLTPNQFRLFKSKAKAKLERLGRERLYAQVA